MMEQLKKTFKITINDIVINTSQLKILILLTGMGAFTCLFALIMNSFLGFVLFPVSCIVAPLIVFYIYTQLDDIVDAKILAFLQIEPNETLAESTAEQ